MGKGYYFIEVLGFDKDVIGVEGRYGEKTYAIVCQGLGDYGKDADGAIMPIKTFDDCLSDFYLYLLEAKPKRVADDVEGYYLQLVKAERQLPQYAEIVSLRKSKRRPVLSTNLFNNLYGSKDIDACLSPSDEFVSFKRCECCEPCESTFFDLESDSKRTENRIVRLFKEFIGL